MQRIGNWEDTIDSRDVIERIAELEADQEAGLIDEDDARELKSLLALAEQASPYSYDWDYGSTLISDSYFPEYARQLLEDCGGIPRGLPSYIEIDWESTAVNLQADYTQVDFDGAKYWVR